MGHEHLHASYAAGSACPPYVAEGRAAATGCRWRLVTLLDFNGDSDISEIEAAFRAVHAPLKVLQLDEPHMRKLYDLPLFLLRPDLHIAWHGERAPGNVHELVDRITGW
jgi:hypothetical protein